MWIEKEKERGREWDGKKNKQTDGDDWNVV